MVVLAAPAGRCAEDDRDERSILGFNLIWLYDQKELMQECLTNIKALQLDPPYVGHTFSFDELPDAIRLFQSGKTMGKVVVQVTENK